MLHFSCIFDLGEISCVTTTKLLLNYSFQNSPNNLSGISNPPGTPRDDGELSGNFLHSFQSENVSVPIATSSLQFTVELLVEPRHK